jgi:sugar lactone lactonase YvrE
VSCVQSLVPDFEPGGGFVTTTMMDSTQGFASIQPRANGINVSPDGQALYVAAFGDRQIVNFDRSNNTITKTAATVDVVPDNIRWGTAGKLLTAGGNAPSLASKPFCF